MKIVMKIDEGNKEFTPFSKRQSKKEHINAS